MIGIRVGIDPQDWAGRAGCERKLRRVLGGLRGCGYC